MALKKKNYLSTILIVLFSAGFIFGAGYYAFSGLFQSIMFDDFMMEDDFVVPSPAFDNCAGWTKLTCEDTRWLVSNSRYSTYGYPVESTSYISNGKLRIYSQGLLTKVTYKENLKNRDIKIKGSFIMSGASFGGDVSGGGSILFNDKGVYSKSMTAFEGQNRGGGTVQFDFLFEAIKDFNNPNIFHIIVNGDEVSVVEISENELKISFEPFGVSGGSSGMTGGEIILDFIKSRPYFNCEVENDEAVIRDVFTSDSTFNIHTLAYQPVKFCPDSYPAIKRSFDAQGVRADIQGQLTRQLTQGKNITVNAGETIEMYYIADYIEGMGLRCGLDSAYDTKLKKCVKIIEEAEDIVEVVSNVTFIEVGETQLLFDNELTIADKQIASGSPEYLCASEDNKAYAPQPREECWSLTTDYDNKEIKFIDNEEKQIDDYFNLKWIAEAQYKDGAIKEGYINHFLLTLRTRDLLQVDKITTPNYYVIFSSKEQFCFDIKNNYGNFADSGVLITETKDLLFSQNTEQKAIAFNKGLNSYCLDVDSSEYGKITYEVIPFIKIASKTFFDNEKIIKNFEIVDTNPIKDLEKALAEIQKLNLSISELASRISELTQNKDEQLALINGLNLTLEEKNKLISELELGDLVVLPPSFDEKDNSKLIFTIVAVVLLIGLIVVIVIAKKK